MRKRSKTILLFVAIVVVIVSFAFFTREKEPSYEGRTLSEWLAVYDKFPATNQLLSPPEAFPIDDAIRHIGTNALPFLVARIQYTLPGWQHSVSEWFRAMPSWIPKTGILEWFEFEGRADARSEQAVLAFGALGPIARPAIQPLANLLLVVPANRRTGKAYRALNGIGEETYPILNKYRADLVLDRRAATNRTGAATNTPPR